MTRLNAMLIVAGAASGCAIGMLDMAVWLTMLLTITASIGWGLVGVAFAKPTYDDIPPLPKFPRQRQPMNNEWEER